MEAEELTVGRVHHGHNIRRFRIEKNMNQEVLSQLVHLSQSAVSKYEQMRVIDDEMLHRFSRALGVPFEYLKSLEEDAQTVVFENNTVNDSEQYTGGAKISLGTVKSYTEDSDNSTDNRVNNFNPIEKITELYERLLKEKDEKYAALCSCICFCSCVCPCSCICFCSCSYPVPVSIGSAAHTGTDNNVKSILVLSNIP